MFTKIKNSIEKENKIINDNFDEINRKNKKLIQAVIWSTMGILALNILFVYTFENLLDWHSGHIKYSYFNILLVATVFSGMIHHFRKVRATTWMYVVYTACMIFAIYDSTFLSKYYANIFILSLLFQIPVLFIESGFRLNSMVIGMGAIYLLCITPFKHHTLMIDEVANVISFIWLGIFAGYFTRGYRLENIAIKSDLRKLAYIDSLTNVKNRRALLNDVEELFEEKDGISGLAVLDIDNFKYINDVFGHQVGDELLRELGTYLSNIENSLNVSVYRYGGEEFVVVFPPSFVGDIKATMERICEEISNYRFFQSRDFIHQVTISIGLALQEYIDPISYENFFTCADNSLYQAKDNGKNQVVVFE